MDEIRFELQSVLVGLFDEFFAADAERVTRLARNVLKKPPETGRMFRLFFQANVAIDFDEFTKLVGRHLFITLLRRAISALDAVHRDAARPQHAFNLSQHLIFLLETDVAKDIET